MHRTWLKLIFGHKKDGYWIQSHLPYPDGDFKNLTITKRLIQSSDIRIGEYPMDRIAPEKESKAPLEGKTVLITGGGRGIGAATAKLLASRGANVIVNYLRNKEAAERLVAEIKSSKETEQQHTAGDAITIQADVRDADQVQRMVDEAIRKYGQIDILVNNANTGRYELKAFLETTWQDFLERYSDEMKAAYEVTRSVLPSMLKRQYGKLIYITTGSARYTMPEGVMTFAIAKSSLVTFSRYLAQEFGKQGITSNILAPGLTETDANAYIPQEAKQQIASLTARGRVGKPEDVAGAVAFLASDDSNFVTGTYIPVDGGFILVG